MTHYVTGDDIVDTLRDLSVRLHSLCLLNESRLIDRIAEDLDRELSYIEQLEHENSDLEEQLEQLQPPSKEVMEAIEAQAKKLKGEVAANGLAD
jgi:hypothetical protein